MPTPFFPLNDERRRRLIRGLEHRLSDHRTEMEAMSKELSAERLRLDSTFEETSKNLFARQKQETDTAVTDWDQQREDTWSRRDRTTLTSLRSEAKKNRELQESYQQDRTQRVAQHKAAREKLDRQYEELKPRPAKILDRFIEVLHSHRLTADQMLEEYRDLMAARSVSIPTKVNVAATNYSPPATSSAANERIQSLLTEMRKQLEDTRKHFIVRFAGSILPWLIGLLPGVVVGIAMWMFYRDQPVIAVGTTLATVFLGPVIFVFSLMPRVKRTLRQPYPILLQNIEHIATLSQAGKSLAETQCRQDEARLLKEYQDRVATLDTDHENGLKQLEQQLERDQKLNREQHIGARLRARSDSATTIEKVDSDWKAKVAKLDVEHRNQALSTNKQHVDAQDALDRRLGELKRNLEYRIRVGVGRAHDWIARQQTRKDDRFPSWDDHRWRNGNWSRFNDSAATTLPVGVSMIRIGDEFEASMPIEFEWLRHGSLIIEANAEHREQARDVLLSLTARAFTTLPMGRLNCTIVDPEGLGRDFSWLMPLADADPRLVGHRVWTQSTQISEQLAMLAYQTEDIIQQRLRDRYANLLEYNAEAGPMAEPFRLLVWANFPFGLDEVSWRALCSILASGARCGIGVLMTIDPNHPWPPFADREKVRGNGLRLLLKEACHVDDPVIGNYECRLDAPPASELLTTIIEHCTQSALDAGKIEVPFETIRVEDSAFGAGKSDDGLIIPLGVAGVGRTTSLRLGQGTAQHVLIAGKTGSGKSSLLHTLITSAAVKYAPDQLRLVLLDFKKGVEFQVYAQAKLAHAEIIGIESRREFGLSAFEYLDRVMQRRGEMFREAGVQDVPGWVRKRPMEAMPRILVVIDEFQEMFIEDDKLSQQASMLLDRIVRQGRSFGIHVVLASQTIGGSYSVPRTTLAQMAVRIALQCDSADAMMILSEDNIAATRLRHSGQAIYNDAGGRVESNQPFQVAFLRSNLHRAELARIVPCGRPNDPSTNLLGRQIIFEGHKPADWSEDDVRRGLRCSRAATLDHCNWS